jgi:protease-4
MDQEDNKPDNGDRGQFAAPPADQGTGPAEPPPHTGPEWGAAMPQPWSHAPQTGWPIKPNKGGIMRQHPIIMVMLILLVAGALLTIVAAAIGSRGQANDGVVSFGFGKKVGVVKVEGMIMDPKDAVDQIERFIDDDSIAAVVLRVDSPGGSVGAAQEIHDEVKRLAQEKPVVVSMGSVAASGGYYIACPARKIFANGGTITGSIGVIMEITNLEGLFQWMKVKNMVIKSGEFKDAGSPYRPMTDKEKQYLQSIVDNLYQQFEKAVADGRDMPLEKVHELADGRVFTGTQAKQLGLVDEIGSLWQAIDEAAELGGIKGKPRVVWPPKKPGGLLGQLLQGVIPGFKGTAVFDSPVRVMYVIDIYR